VSQSFNPYAPPPPDASASYAAPSALSPQPWGTREVVSLAWGLFQEHWLVLLMSSLLWVFVTEIVAPLLGGMSDRAVIAVPSCLLALFLVAFFHVGGLRMCVATARGQVPRMSMMFSGADRVLPMIGLYFLLGLTVAIGFLLLIVPGIILILGLVYYAPFYLVDARMGPIDAMKASWAASKGQKGEIWWLSFAQGWITFLGLLACGVGYFAAFPFCAVAVSIAFTRASGRSPWRVDEPRYMAMSGGPAPVVAIQPQPQGWGPSGGYGPPPPGGPGSPLTPPMTRKKESRGRALLVALVAAPVIAIASFLALWQFLQPADRKQQVSFTEFASWVHQGQVPDIHVKGGIYDFTRVVDGKSVHMEAHGPIADGLVVQDLQKNPLAAEGKFKIYFE
jgi:hypothetical protein